MITNDPQKFGYLKKTTASPPMRPIKPIRPILSGTTTFQSEVRPTHETHKAHETHIVWHYYFSVRSSSRP